LRYRKDFGSSYKLIFIGALAYIASQGIKLLIFALMVPSQEDGQVTFEPFQELFKNAMCFIDVVAVRYALNYVKAGGSDSYLNKIYAVTLGWAGLQTFLSYFFYILVNAFSSEFQWECIQTAIQCNLDLVLSL